MTFIEMDRVVEIILYQLKSGTGRKFHKIMKDISVPLHRSKSLNILAFGNSMDNVDEYFLIRLFDSHTQMTTALNNFYSSDAWQDGPRSEIIDNIKISTKVVLTLNEEAINSLKSSWCLGHVMP